MENSGGRGRERRREAGRRREVAKSYGPPRACFQCKIPVRATAIKTLGGQVFHPGCLRCGACQVLLEAERAKVKANRIYCPLCFNKAFLPPCRVCNRPVEEREASIIDFPSFHNVYQELQPRLVAQALFHTRCLRCELPTCRRQLRPGTAFRNGSRLFCSPACTITARATIAAAQPNPSLPSSNPNLNADLFLSAPLLAHRQSDKDAVLSSARDDDASQWSQYSSRSARSDRSQRRRPINKARSRSLTPNPPTAFARP